MGIFDFLNASQTGTQDVVTSIDPQVKAAYLANLNAADQVASRDYQQYQGPRIAPFSQDQLNAFQNIRDMQGQYQPFINSASSMLQQSAGMAPQQLSYQGPTATGYSAPNASLASLSAPAITTGIGYNANTFGGATAGNASQSQAFGYNPAQSGYTSAGAPFLAGSQGYNPTAMGAANAGPSALSTGRGYNATSTTAANAGNAYLSGAAGINRGGIRDVFGGSFLSGNVNAYMNPYTSGVIDQTLNDIQRAKDLDQQNIAANAVRSGAYGGSRQAVAEAESARNFNDQFARTAAQLRNQGFDTASGLMQSDLNRNLQAQGQNQSADLNVAGQNAGYLQQANLANQSASNQMAQFNAGNQQQANLANQNAQNTASQFGAQAGNTASLANQSAINAMNQFNAGNQQQANLANQNAFNTAGQFGAQAGNTASLANQQAANNMAQFDASNRQAVNLANMGAANQANSFLAGARNTSSLANQNANNQMAQFNAGNLQQAGLANMNARNTAGQFGATAQNNANQLNQSARNDFAMQNFLAGNAMNQFNTTNQLGANRYLADTSNQFALNNANQNFNAQQQNVANNQAYANRLSNLGSQMSGLGAMGQSLGLNATNALNTMGGLQQQQVQRNYDLANQDFQNQFQYPLQQLAIRQNALQAQIPNAGQTTSTPMYENQIGNLLGLLGSVNSLTDSGSGGVVNQGFDFLSGLGSDFFSNIFGGSNQAPIVEANTQTNPLFDSNFFI